MESGAAVVFIFAHAENQRKERIASQKNTPSDMHAKLPILSKIVAKQ